MPRVNKSKVRCYILLCLYSIPYTLLAAMITAKNHNVALDLKILLSSYIDVCVEHFCIARTVFKVALLNGIFSDETKTSFL